MFFNHVVDVKTLNKKNYGTNSSIKFVFAT